MVPAWPRCGMDCCQAKLNLVDSNNCAIWALPVNNDFINSFVVLYVHYVARVKFFWNYWYPYFTSVPVLIALRRRYVHLTCSRCFSCQLELHTRLHRNKMCLVHTFLVFYQDSCSDWPRTILGIMRINRVAIVFISFRLLITKFRQRDETSFFGDQLVSFLNWDYRQLLDQYVLNFIHQEAPLILYT